MNYLFIGEDEFSKDIKLQRIKQELDLVHLESFNFEVIYSRDVDTKTLQERLLVLPFKAKQRLILIKDIASLKPDAKKYLLSFLKKPFPHVCLILDARRFNLRDQFLRQISGLTKKINFRQSGEINAFTFARQVMQPGPKGSSLMLQKKAASALRLLRQLLLRGERPEKILGAIRYQLHQEGLSPAEQKKKLTLLLNCDIDIKTGRLKPEFALERLLVGLCGL